MSEVKPKKIWGKVLDLIFPKECLGCRQEGTFICPNCRQTIIKIKTPYCPRCKRITKNGQFCSACRSRFALSGVIMATHFEKGVIRETIHAYKYESIVELKKFFASLILERMKNKLPRGEKIIIPIPLHPRREMERGYNQAQELAKEIAKKLHLPIEDGALTRIKKTAPQMRLRRKNREANIAGAFKCQKRDKIIGKTILLVDDVMTTGLTLNEAAKTLRRAGARQVWGVVIAG